MRVDTRKVPETPLMVCDVQASVGGAYRVAVSRGDKLTCQCKGWQYRRECRHTKGSERVAEGARGHRHRPQHVTQDTD